MSQLWFEIHRLPHSVISRFVAYRAFVKPLRHELLLNELELPEHAVVDWSNYLREMCINVITQQPAKTGGFGKVVEINEAKIGTFLIATNGTLKSFSNFRRHSWSLNYSACYQRLYTTWYNKSQ